LKRTEVNHEGFLRWVDDGWVRPSCQEGLGFDANKALKDNQNLVETKGQDQDRKVQSLRKHQGGSVKIWTFGQKILTTTRLCVATWISKLDPAGSSV